MSLNVFGDEFGIIWNQIPNNSIHFFEETITGAILSGYEKSILLYGGKQNQKRSNGKEVLNSKNLMTHVI